MFATYLYLRDNKNKKQVSQFNHFGSENYCYISKLENEIILLFVFPSIHSCLVCSNHVYTLSIFHVSNSSCAFDLGAIEYC